MTRTLRLFTLASAAALVLLLGCGGGATAPVPAPEPKAVGLGYTDPTGSGWRLVRDASSTPTRLVLNLVGPSGTRTRGAGFNLRLPEGVKAGTFSQGLPLQDTGVYQLRMLGSSDPQEPLALTGGVKPGRVLSVGLFQKDREQPAVDSGVPVCRIALAFDAGAGLTAGTRLPLAVLKAKVIPQDIGAPGDDLWTLDQKMRLADISLAVGTLTAL